MERKLYSLKEFDIFAGSSAEMVDSLVQSYRYRISHFRRGDIVAMQGERCNNLMLLHSGQLTARMMNEEGRELTIDHLTAPDILAPAFIYSRDNRMPVTLYADDDSSIGYLAREDFLDLMQHDSEILRRFLQNISDRTSFLTRKLKGFALQSLGERVMDYLREHGTIDNIQELSERMGVARPSLSRAIATLVESRRIVRDNNRYILPAK